ncbi:hypothetical protein CkaCkLH20_12226 [Colletotrichum karsti]|uniref:Uncharacterized protein n=1 Tax=Colletotrichum karsti TaxID=1095194 RepID=A0A9P6HUT9_9PEZI|nr:uncharacterized protein CkaCkLH20_12226 [Colletotrichum karsti]KAF9870262.1 hypothetical protein CkaCkLH20_12226 [Colletotrichum karsti]
MHFAPSFAPANIAFPARWLLLLFASLALGTLYAPAPSSNDFITGVSPDIERLPRARDVKAGRPRLLPKDLSTSHPQPTTLASRRSCDHYRQPKERCGADVPAILPTIPGGFSSSRLDSESLTLANHELLKPEQKAPIPASQKMQDIQRKVAPLLASNVSKDEESQ